MTLKLLLLSPPIFDFYYTPARREPLGLLYIRAALLAKWPELQVDLYDARESGRKKKQAWPEYLSYLQKIYVPDQSHFSLLQNFYRFGDSFPKIYDNIKDNEYDIIAISSLFSAYHDDVEKLVRFLKQRITAQFIVGGWAIYAQPQKWQKTGSADYYFSGDGEHEIINYIDQFLREKTSSKPSRQIRKEYLKKNRQNDQKMHYYFFLNNFPCRDHFPIYQKKKIASVMTSKGCLYRCRFCSVNRRYAFMHRSLPSIAKEFNYLYNMGAQIINFEDDNLFFQKDFALELIKLMREYKQHGLRYTAMNGITAVNLHKVLEPALQAGFMEWNFALVSGHAPTLQNQKRQHQQSILSEIVQSIADQNAQALVSNSEGKYTPITVFIIAGLAQSAPKIVLQDILFLAQWPVQIGYSPLYMLPNIPEFEDMGLPEQTGLLRGSALYKFGENFTREDVASLWKFTRMINFLKQLNNGPTGFYESFEHDTLKKQALMKENLRFFTRSIIEKQWYAKQNDAWVQTFHFNIDFPLEITIRNIYNETQIINLTDHL